MLVMSPVSNHVDGPVFRFEVFSLDHSASKIYAEIALEVVLIEEVVLDEISLVTAGDVEVLHPMMGIVLHDMPQDGTPADLDHRLGTGRCFFLKSSFPVHQRGLLLALHSPLIPMPVFV